MVLVIAGIGLMFILKKPEEEQAPAEEDSGETSSSSRFPTAKVESKAPSGNSKISGMVKKIEKVRKEKGDSKLKELAQHQVDAPPEDFFGRRAEIINVVDKNKEGHYLNGFNGPHGIGKTATALKVIDKITPLFPEAQVYFNFDLAEDPELAPEEAMGHLINSLAPHQKTPSSPEQLVFQYRKLLHGKKILLFFDNVKTSAQVMKLMPPSKSVGIILTSEEKLKVEGVHWETIEPLPEEDLKELLSLWASRIGFWTAEIGRYSSFNPLAASLCGRFLCEYASFDPEQFATKMRDIYKGLEKSIPDRNQAGIETMLTILFLVIPDPIKMLLCKLLLFPADFYGEAESFICEDKENVKLELLVRLGFVEINEHTDRYQVPPTLQRWLKTKVNKTTLGQADLRRATYYMSRLQMLSDLFHSNQATKKDQALQLFDIDWKNIKAGQAWAQANCLKDNEVAKICQGYAELGYPMLQLRQSAKNRLPWLEGGLLASKNLQDEEGELNCLLYLGEEYNTVKDWPKAIESLEKSLALAEKKGNEKIKLNILHGLGIASKGQKNWTKALDHFQNEVGAAEKLEQDAVVLRAQEEIAKTCVLSKDPKQALTWLEKALGTAKKIKDNHAEARLLASLGQAQLQSGDTEGAIETLQNALKTQSKSGDPKSIAELHHTLADAFAEIEEPAKAASSYQKAAVLFQQNRDSLGHAKSSGMQGVCLMMAGDPDQGVKLANTARSILRKIKAIPEELRILNLMGRSFIAAEKWDEALKSGQKQRQLAQKAKKSESEARALWTMGEAMEGKNNSAEALPLLKKALTLLGSRLPDEAKKLNAKIQKLEAASAKPQPAKAE